MAEQIDERELYKWIGRVDEQLGGLGRKMDELKQDYQDFEKETRVHRETVESRLVAGNVKFNSQETRIEKLETRNGIKNKNNSAFVSWKWIVEKFSQPILLLVINFVIIYVLMQVLK